MEKVEQYIKEHTKETSSPIIDWDGNIAIYQPWLTPGQARRVAAIAREETIKEVCEWMSEKLPIYISYCERGVGEGSTEFVEDLKKHFKGEA